MGPGLRRESVLVAVPCTAGRQRRWGTNKKQDGPGMRYGKNASPAKEAVTQLASTNMVTIQLLPFLAIPAQAGTHASTST